MKLIEHFNDYDMVSTDNTIVNKHNYLRFRFGRLKHNFWLKSRKSNDTIYIDAYDNFILQNLKPGKTCYFGSSGYYLDGAIDDLTVIEQHPVVKTFYPDAVIVKNRGEIGKLYPNVFDNFVVVNNRGDIWTSLYDSPDAGFDLDKPSIEDHVRNYIKSMKDGCVFFYSFRDTQIVNWNRISTNHYDYFYNFALYLKKYGLNLLWHNIKFAEKHKQPDESYDILENPDTLNGNIKLIFQYNNNTHTIDTTHFEEYYE